MVLAWPLWNFSYGQFFFFMYTIVSSTQGPSQELLREDMMFMLPGADNLMLLF